MVAYCAQVDARCVTDVDEIARLRSFQAQRYWECGLIDDLPESLPPDPLDEHARYFAAYADDNTTVLATCRVVFGQAASMPVVNDFALFPEWRYLLDSCGDSACEITRLAVSDDAPKLHAISAMVREMLRWGLANTGIRSFTASVEPPFAAALRRRLLMSPEVIGESRDDYFNATNLPIYIDVVAWIERLRQQKPDMWSYFIDGVVLDPELYEQMAAEALYPPALRAG